MLEALLTVFSTLTEIPMILSILGGAFAGIIFGMIPGLNALIAVPLFLPFLFGMNPYYGIAMLLSMGSVTQTAGSVTSVLVGIPGCDQNIASLEDCYALTKQGRAHEALGAALVSSGLGGLLGGLVLLLLIPFMAPVLLYFASPEQLMMVLVGVLFIALLSKDKIKGTIAGLLGLLFSLVGMSTITGQMRFTFGNINLMDGIRLVPVALGMFAIPELISMFFRKDDASATDITFNRADISPKNVAKSGFRAVFQHPFLFLRSSLMGIFIGIIPAIGGAATSFLLYGFAKSTAKNPELFGKGSIEGVVGPEAGNNAKDAGALVPTLAFGIPGSLLMALYIGAFMVIGVTPGPSMFRDHMDVVMLLPIIIILANLVAAAMLIIASTALIKLIYLRKGILPSVLLVTCTCGAFLIRQNWFDVLLFLGFGVLGYVSKKYDYNRSPFILGFVLGALTERYLFVTMRVHGWAFLGRPIVMGILALIILYMIITQIKERKKKRTAEPV